MAMAMPQKRLGRGLASLIGDPANTDQALPVEGEQRIVQIDQVQPSPLNPRKEFKEEDLEELANSLSEKGLVQPLIVRPRTGGGYEIVAGERRWRAAQRAQLHQIAVIVRDLTDKEVLELAIIENVQRADLNPIEEAIGYGELMNRFEYTQDDVATVIGKSRSHLANTLRLLKLPESVQRLVQKGELSAGHARALVGRENAEELARQILAKRLNVRDVEMLVQSLEAKSGSQPKSKKVKDADTKAFEKELADAIGLKTEIKLGGGESGVLCIRYDNFDQLDYVRRRILGTPAD